MGQTIALGTYGPIRFFLFEPHTPLGRLDGMQAMEFRSSRSALLLALLHAVLLELCCANPPGCECTGTNIQMGEDNQDRYGKDYGTWCAAWDDGVCTPFKITYDFGEHPCEGTHTSSCEVLWPDTNWNQDNSWCCDSWCWVGPECNASYWGIDLVESALTRDEPNLAPEDRLWFSYGACPDWRSRSTYPPDGSKDFSAYSQEECPYYPWPQGCNCVDNSLLGDDLLFHGRDYGSWCAAWEDDHCDPDATAADAPLHTCLGEGAANCESHWPSSQWTTNQFWCCDAWCYVNATCDGKRHRIDVKDSWVTPLLKYSYGACADWNTKPTPTRGNSGWLADWSYYSKASCPWRAKVEGCECLGDNSELGEDLLAQYGKNYGKWCAAWDDGKCTEEDDIQHLHTQHTCDGTMQEEKAGCEVMWGEKWNFSDPQMWCCASWCYVDPITCTPELQELHGIRVLPSWVQPSLYYSYESCFDSIQRPTIPSHGPLDYAQYTKDTCPYREGIPGFVFKAEEFVPITEHVLKDKFDIYIQQNNKSNSDAPGASAAASLRTARTLTAVLAVVLAVASL